MDGLDGVVEIGEINLGVRTGRELVLGLCEEKIMLVISEELALLGVEVDVVTPDLGSAGGCVTIPALNTQFYIVVL